jgi:hypothetical protein
MSSCSTNSPRSAAATPFSTSTVEVIGTPPVSEALTRSDSKSGDAINSLALNFRATANPSPIVIANLAPGVQSDNGGNITIAGQLPTATSFSLDGVSTQLPRFGGPTRDLFPSVEGISEFRVNTAANSAEFSQAHGRDRDQPGRHQRLPWRRLLVRAAEGPRLQHTISTNTPPTPFSCTPARTVSSVR